MARNTLRIGADTVKETRKVQGPRPEAAGKGKTRL